MRKTLKERRICLGKVQKNIWSRLLVINHKNIFYSTRSRRLENSKDLVSTCTGLEIKKEDYLREPVKKTRVWSPNMWKKYLKMAWNEFTSHNIISLVSDEAIVRYFSRTNLAIKFCSNLTQLAVTDILTQ